ncbi:MAG: hypothetical protein KY459_16555 [Acidobacteria bacterium]|nr:hypothetical protein [Acidobacteriota bacterium]
MTSWQKELPHQIPFRAVSSIGSPEEDSVTAGSLISANDAGRDFSPDFWLVEAMAQAAGRMAFGADALPGQLVAIDRYSVEQPPVIGDCVALRVKALTSLGNLHRFEATAMIDDVQIASATLTLSPPGGSP